MVNIDELAGEEAIQLLGTVGEDALVQVGDRVGLLDPEHGQWRALPEAVDGGRVTFCPVADGVLAVGFEDLVNAGVARSEGMLPGETRIYEAEPTVGDRRTAAFLPIEAGKPAESWTVEAVYAPGEEAPSALTAVCTADGVALVPPVVMPGGGDDYDYGTSTGYVLGDEVWRTIEPLPGNAGVHPITARSQEGAIIIGESAVFVAQGGFGWSALGDLPPGPLGDASGYATTAYFTTEVAGKIYVHTIESSK